MAIKLSVCIPTYNHGALIGEAIESIISQATDEVEIVISDNGSSDNTEQIVRKYQQQFPHLTYFRGEKNVGFDRNVLNVIDLAKGEYCWLMSSDDRAEPGALPHILSQLDRYPGLCGASVNQTMYTPDMRTMLTGAPVADGRLSTDYLFSDADTCFSLLGLYFGYMSGQIVNRAVWNQVVNMENLDPYCTGFIHVYMIGSMLKQNPAWLYIHKPCAGYRSGNDSLVQEVGIYGRQVIAHTHFEALLRELFGRGGATYNSVLHMALVQYMRGDLAYFKSHGASLGLQLKLFALYLQFYWRFPYFWLKVCPIFLIPNILVKVLRDFYLTKLKRVVE